ncbi:MAG: 3-phosphoshikimate 1-carboxyvinyltransferase [Firmicutes bacterium]|nr:3-phosphoshikimate 1-carboxyvinyltransferase [Bacillota bacterium]
MEITGCSRIRARVGVPGDKSISHRAAMIGAIAEGETILANFSPGADCLATLDCLRALGVAIECPPGRVSIRGVGLSGLREPADILDCGNSGTTMRLLAGILAGQSFVSVLTGDASLRNRPMGRIIQPLRRMGATVDGRENGSKAPLFIRGPSPERGCGLLPLRDYTLPVASAQLKSCLMFAGLYARGTTTLLETTPSRDHTERILRLFGAKVRATGGSIGVDGFPRLQARHLEIPGDISSAAFWLAAAAISPGSEVLVESVGLNRLRSGFLHALRRMGCPVEVSPAKDGWEPSGDVRAVGGTLHGIEITPEEVPSLIDEIPLVAVCAAVARGKTIVRGANELRHKECDRISAVIENLTEMGVPCGETPDGFWVEGVDRLRGGFIRTHGDHRIAMAFAVAALAAEGETVIDDADCVSVSYPGFFEVLGRLSESDSAGRVPGHGLD